VTVKPGDSLTPFVKLIKLQQQMDSLAEPLLWLPPKGMSLQHVYACLAFVAKQIKPENTLENTMHAAIFLQFHLLFVMSSQELDQPIPGVQKPNHTCSQTDS
jgi:hypothetical protein